MTKLPRAVGKALRERLSMMPALRVTGARQMGESTLAEHLVPGRRQYHSLDKLDVVQRAPEILHAVERAIDRDRAPGRVLLTVSANLLQTRQVSESLAGHAARSRGGLGVGHVGVAEGVG